MFGLGLPEAMIVLFFLCVVALMGFILRWTLGLGRRNKLLKEQNNVLKQLNDQLMARPKADD